MSIGRKIYLESENILKDYQLFFSIYKKYNPDMLFCVSPLLQTLKNVIEKLPNCNLKILAVGGLLLDSKYTKFFLNKNIRIHNGYGTTETGVLLIANHKNMLKNNISVGVPVKNDVKFKILNDGELIIKSSAMMLGYYEQNKIFVPFDSNGYFHTNDLVYPQKCSIFKKMIIVSGRKTSSMNKTWKTVSCIENNNNVKNSKEIIFPDGSIKIIE
jgi:long-subunit acyl-CoA synthetase (AMP-forming)